MSLLSAFRVGTSALTAQSQRLNVIASNLANVESSTGPDGRPYRARQVVFQSAYLGPAMERGVRVAAVVEDPSALRRVYRPGHPNADELGYVDLPNVNPVDEMVNMISASRSYQMNVDAMNTSRQLLLKTLDLGR